MVVTQKKKRIAKKKSAQFYRLSFLIEKENDDFYDEYNILSKTVESVNNFRDLYKIGRVGAKGGPSTHIQQDLYRAMLVFACAGLDVFVKQLIRNKLPQLLNVDKDVQNKFKEYVKRGIKKDGKEILNTVALALIDNNPRDVFLSEYIESLTRDSLQSVSELYKISDASGLDTKKIFGNGTDNRIKDVFNVRNEIIHEMDINIDDSTSRTTGYRTRRQRRATTIEKHTKSILNLTEEIFNAYRYKFQAHKIGVDKNITLIKDPSDKK